MTTKIKRSIMLALFVNTSLSACVLSAKGVQPMLGVKTALPNLHQAPNVYSCVTEIEALDDEFPWSETTCGWHRNHQVSAATSHQTDLAIPHIH